MHFRTEIVIPRNSLPAICHDNQIMMLGSCFTDNIGTELLRDGFNVTHNPMGPLYNPASLLATVQAAVRQKVYMPFDFVMDSNDVWHCLDFSSRYQAPSADELAIKVNTDFATIAHAFASYDTAIFTLGTAYVYERNDIGTIVGNCHKLPSQFFTRRLLSLQECITCLQTLLNILPPNFKNVIFTVSPIRHTSDGLHQNQISKSTLMLAIDSIRDARFSYFPSYEIMLDDLRDYRFYAADMKHPSDVAVEYIYEHFKNACFSEKTKQQAVICRKKWLQAAHRPIITN